MTDLINYLKSQMDTDADFVKVDIEYIPCIIEALGKQIPKKPQTTIYTDYTLLTCPNCDSQDIRVIKKWKLTMKIGVIKWIAQV